jgi:uracil-DNA glycosylase family 4
VQREIDACWQWLEGEISAVKPRVIACLGATAGRALLGKDFKVSLQRGRFIESPWAEFVFATLHPSAILRLRDPEEQLAGFAELVKDLSLITQALRQTNASSQ